MAALDTKLLRDLRRTWAQSLAIALVVAGGVASLVMAVGSLNGFFSRFQDFIPSTFTVTFERV